MLSFCYKFQLRQPWMDHSHFTVASGFAGHGKLLQSTSASLVSTMYPRQLCRVGRVVKQLGKPLQAQLFTSRSLVVAQQQHSHALLLQAHIKPALVSPHLQRCGFSTGSSSKPPLPLMKGNNAASRATSADWNDSSLSQ